MADRDVRVDQSPDDVETEPGGAPTGSSDGGDDDRGTDDVERLPGETADVPEPESTADGPPPMEADEDSLEGIQPGGGGGGGGGGLFGQIADAYDDVEDAVNDATDYAVDETETGAGKVVDGTASLADDIQHEVYEEWKDAGHNQGGFDEHQGGWFADPYGTVGGPFVAADQAYDGVEDDVADFIDRSGVEEAYDDAEDVVNDVIKDVPLEEVAFTFGTGTIGAAYGTGRVLEETGVVDEAYGRGAELVDAVDGPYGSGGGGTGTTDDDDDAAPEGEPAEPPVAVEDTTWEAAEPVVEQAAMEDLQEAAAEVDELAADPVPVDLPVDEAVDLG